MTLRTEVRTRSRSERDEAEKDAPEQHRRASARSFALRSSPGAARLSLASLAYATVLTRSSFASVAYAASDSVGPAGGYGIDRRMHLDWVADRVTKLRMGVKGRGGGGGWQSEGSDEENERGSDNIDR